MQATLADGSTVSSDSVCQVPLIICDSAANPLLFVVECRVVNQLSHAAVLGMDWLMGCNPQINWSACTVAINVDGNQHVLSAIPRTTSAGVSLCSIKSWDRELRRGNIAWFGFVRTLSADDAMEACGSMSGGDPVVATQDSTHWNQLCDEFVNVFAAPGTPAE